MERRLHAGHPIEFPRHAAQQGRRISRRQGQVGGPVRQRGRNAIHDGRRAGQIAGRQNDPVPGRDRGRRHGPIGNRLARSGSGHPARSPHAGPYRQRHGPIVARMHGLDRKRPDLARDHQGDVLASLVRLSAVRRGDPARAGTLDRLGGRGRRDRGGRVGHGRLPVVRRAATR